MTPGTECTRGAAPDAKVPETTGAGSITAGVACTTRLPDAKLPEIVGGGLITSGAAAVWVAVRRVTAATVLTAGAGGITAACVAAGSFRAAVRTPPRAGVGGITGASATTAGIRRVFMGSPLTFGDVA